MLRENTVFVVGAGASHEYKLPTGPSLATEISKLLDIRFDDLGRRMASGDEQVWETARRFAQGDVRDYQLACWLIRDGVALSSSIDDFLDTHAENPRAQLCGRLGIVRAILNAERHSTLYFSPTERDSEINFPRIADLWASHLFRMLQRGVRISDCDKLFENATFIVFNYDRCLEHFLFRAVRRIYRLSEQDAARVVKRATIIHPYGTVGSLPWQGEARQVAFGQEDAPIDQLKDGIRTYTNRLDEPEFVARIRTLVSGAHTIVFLGFAYHQQNLDLLFDGREAAPSKVFGTAYGISDYNREWIERDMQARLTKIRGQKLYVINSLRCAELLEQYSRGMTT